MVYPARPSYEDFAEAVGEQAGSTILPYGDKAIGGAKVNSDDHGVSKRICLLRDAT